MKILVTGGAGFIGSNIVDAYINAGHEVVVIDDLSTGRIQNVNSKAEFICANIQDMEVAESFLRHKFDVVNHQAAQMDVRRSVEDPIYDAKNNVLGFINILQNCAKTGVKKVIFSSSGGAIYGEQDYFPADEEHKLQPCSPYGITKLVGEKYLFFYAQNYGLKYIALRYANVYGPRQNPHGEAGVVAIFTRMLLKNQQPVINGNGEQTRDFVFVQDVVRANVLALEQKDSNIFNVGTSKETTINELYRILLKKTGSALIEKHGPGKEGEQFRSVIAYNKAQKLMGWSPRYDIEKGLEETVAYFRKNEVD
ncbi:MAG TPA: NAD-dependent epimerase/dehydratase family protein [bacterium]|nr:NAD-dependent epimerase/dehydratase family protein [bacterium]HPN42252.1 NAD-dependent epimerase/dehydratase family protein [bacterium]